MVLAVGTERSRRAGHTEPHGVAVIALEVELQGEPLLLARLGLSGVDETQDGFFPYRAVSWADGTGKVKLQSIISVDLGGVFGKEPQRHGRDADNRQRLVEELSQADAVGIVGSPLSGGLPPHLLLSQEEQLAVELIVGGLQVVGLGFFLLIEHRLEFSHKSGMPLEGIGHVPYQHGLCVLLFQID